MNTPPALPWHDTEWRRIQDALRRGRLPHALLLHGPPGLGKSGFARRLASALLCRSPADSGDACGQCASCRQAAAGAHPDIAALVPAEPGKAIRIDAVRRFTAGSVLAARPGGHRVAIIDPADALNRAAANALLKTLEEPVPGAVMLLVSSHADRLLPTLRSRCQAVGFRVPPADDLRDWLAGQVDTAEIDDLLAVSGGAPLRALQARAEAWLETGQQLVSQLGELKARRVNPLQTVEEWENRPLNQVLDAFKRCVTDLARLAGGLDGGRLYLPTARDKLQRLGQGIDLRDIHRFHDELMRLEREMEHNLNTPMLLEHLANRWLQITRPGV